jgi:3-hydroxy-9,10-secoandrosta-1,3,5(10)-triene-9,17-dione monooxygenase
VSQITVPAEADEQRQQITIPRISAEIQAVVAEIDAKRDVLRSEGAESEARGGLTSAAFDVVRSSGALRTCVPPKFGGYGANSLESTAVSRALGRGDGSVAWVFAIVNSGTWILALMAMEAQEEVWATGPDTVVSVVLAPTCTVEKVDGGYRVSGRWAYGTGSHQADWSLLGMPLVDDAGNQVDGALALIPASDFTIEQTWDMAGMRATASDTQVVDNAFVPEHRILPLTAAIDGTYPGSGIHSEISYRTAFVPALALQLVGPHLGMGRAVSELVVEKARTKAIAYTGYTRQADFGASQMATAQAELLLETAENTARIIGEDLYGAAAAGSYPDFNQRVALRARLGYAVQCVTDAINLMLTVHGSSSFASSSPVQRFWRDQTVAASHAHSLPATGLEAYGRVLLGLDEEARFTMPVL